MVVLDAAVLVIDPPWTIYDWTEQPSFRDCQREGWENEPALQQHLAILQKPSILRTGAAHAVHAGREQWVPTVRSRACMSYQIEVWQASS
ncbi:hypothetical protein FOMA001_g10854 [Fusarium oxysporum f. sp. matthiolae]|nr:hypothetical protein FOMA001_g10854 [Fusarium oxysporum f. sp. matthiolae]